MGLPKPTTNPIWATNVGVRTDPGLAKQETGWVFQEAPPASVMNHIQGVQGDLLAWLSERIADGNGGSPTGQFRIPDFGLGFLTYYAQIDNNGIDLLDGDLRIRQNGASNGGRIVLRAGELEYFGSGTSRWTFTGGSFIEGFSFKPTKEGNINADGEINRRNTIAASGNIVTGVLNSAFNIASVDSGYQGVPGRYRLNFSRAIQTANRVVLISPIEDNRWGNWSPIAPFNANEQVVEIRDENGIPAATSFSVAIIGA